MSNKKTFTLSMAAAIFALTLHSPLYGEIPKDRWSSYQNSARITSLDGESSLHILFSCEKPGYAYLIERHQLVDAYRSPDPKISSLPESMIELYKNQKINRTFVFGGTQVLDQGKRVGSYEPDALALTLASQVKTDSQLIGMLRLGQSVESYYYLVTGELFLHSRYTLKNSDSSILEALACER